MAREPENFLKRIQNAPEPVRKRWLVALTAVSMIGIISLWMGYLNAIVQPVDVAPLKSEPEEESL